MTKDDVLQKVNDYCTEKSYTSETLTDEFKDKFADFFSKKYEETSPDDESMIADLQFNINTAFSATSKGITAKAKAFEVKENEYKKKIKELSEANPNDTTTQTDEPKLPKDLQDKLDKLEQFESEARRKEKFKEVLGIAKKKVRQDLHKSLESYATDFAVSLDEESEEQAKKLTSRFQDIFRDSIGDIKPLAPQVTHKRDEEFLASIPKIKV